MAEVRDLTPVRDPDGRVGALPELEQVLAACCDALRWARARQPGRVRPAELEPGAALRVARGRQPPRRAAGPRARARAAHRGPRPRAGGHPGPRSARARDAPMRDRVVRLGYESGQGLTFRLTEPPTEPMLPARRLHAEGARRPAAGATPTPTSWCPLLARSRRPLHRVRPRGAEPAAGGARRRAGPSTTGWCRSTAPGGNRAGVVVGARDHAHGQAPRGHDPGRHARRPDPGARLDRRGRVPPAARRHRPRRGAGRARSSGSRCRPAPRSPCRAAARTSTGWAGCCAASSSTPSAAAR